VKITIVTGLLAKWNVEIDHGVLLGSKGKEFECTIIEMELLKPL